jgi:hypothetical protein
MKAYTFFFPFECISLNIYESKNFCIFVISLSSQWISPLCYVKGRSSCVFYISSTYKISFAPWIFSVKSFMYNRNNSSPRTNPCGTPNFTVALIQDINLISAPSERTYYFGIKLSNHLPWNNKKLAHNIKQFRAALNAFLHYKSFYTGEEYFDLD